MSRLKQILVTIIVPTSLSGSKAGFALYSVIAWSVPALLIAIPLALHLKQSKSDFQPYYGETNCWIDSKYALLTFVIAPLSVIMLLNVYFFSWTSWLIHTTRAQASTASSATRRDFVSFLKLAIIMGLTWITGVVASFVDHEGDFILFTLFMK